MRGKRTLTQATAAVYQFVYVAAETDEARTNPTYYSAVRFGSVCSGIEAASAAWQPLGWKAAWFSETAAFPSAVLAHRYPDVPNLGDMTRIHDNETFKNEEIDVLDPR